MNILYIIRGLPGSGKTTLSIKLAPTSHYEVDQYFTSPEGVYTFDGSRIRDAHAFCEYNVQADMKLGRPVIAVANTFSRKWEYLAYQELARNYDYNVIEITVRSQFTSIHNVTQEYIEVVRARWEN